MVVFVDLDDGEDEELHHLYDSQHILNSNQLLQLRLNGRQSTPATPSQDGKNPLNLNRNGFSAALSCYPIAVSIATHLDLNDLHALSCTCRQFRANLLEFRRQLIIQSLRCSFDAQPLLADILAAHETISYAGRELEPTNVPTNALEAISSVQRTPLTDHLLGAHSRLLKSSKIGQCARDLVAECRKCSNVVCRNCAAKPPSDRYLKDRFRRLCGACLRAPLEAHTSLTRSTRRIERLDTLLTSPTSSASSIRSCRSESSSSSTCEASTEHASHPEAPSAARAAFTHSAFERSPCCCATRGVFLCQTCGQNLRAADTTYKRVWTWRSRYSTHIGGLGTGMGAGNQGQKCARGEECLDRMGAGLCWVEIDCCEQEGPQQQDYAHSSLLDHDAVGAARDDHHVEESSSSSSSSTDVAGGDDSSSTTSTKPGYLHQEIEGIGGVVKKKVKKKVRTGATVWEFDDERESGKYLEREASGVQRSWCGWCSRVVMGELDRREYGDV